MQRKFVFIGFALLLVSCQAQAKSVVESYLEAVRSGNIQQQKELYCVSKDAASSPIISAPAWTIVGEEQRPTNSSPSFSYKVVTAQVNGVQHRIRVWKTDDVYKHQQVVFDQLNKQGIQLANALQDRSKWSSKATCLIVEKP